MMTDSSRLKGFRQVDGLVVQSPTLTHRQSEIAIQQIQIDAGAPGVFYALSQILHEPEHYPAVKIQPNPFSQNTHLPPSPPVVIETDRLG